jgi:hypothetical protein
MNSQPRVPCRQQGRRGRELAAEALDLAHAAPGRSAITSRRPAEGGCPAPRGRLRDPARGDGIGHRVPDEARRNAVCAA